MKLAFTIALAMALACFANAAFNPPVYRQGDSRWGSTQLGFGSYTIARKGCFLTAQTSMIASQGITINNGETPDPGNMNEWFKDNDQFDGGMLLYKAPQKFGFTYDGKMSSQSDIKNAFNEGKFVLLHVENLSHWVLVTSITSTGYEVMDPAGVETSYKFSEVPEVAVYTAPAGKPGTLSSSEAEEPTEEAEEPTTEPETETETPATSEDPEEEDEEDSLATESLEIHNEWRSAVGVPNLVWNATLAASAQAWADHIASTKSISHSKNRDNIGENIAYGTTKTNSITDFIDLWGEESDYFVKGKTYPKCTTGSESDVWHYTQLVWRKTTSVGCGLGQSNGRSYYVCQYYPRGNIRGQSVF